jgi:hypothetical protein
VAPLLKAASWRFSVKWSRAILCLWSWPQLLLQLLLLLLLLQCKANSLGLLPMLHLLLLLV